MKYRILSILLIITTLTAASCGSEKDPPSPPGSGNGTELKSVMAVVGNYANPSTSPYSTFDEDPTATDAATRAAAGHMMTVELDGNKAVYKYSEPAWVPLDAKGAFFPVGSKQSPVGIVLGPQVSLSQDGTAIGLLNADELEYGDTAVAPQDKLSVTLVHTNALFEVTFTGLKPSGEVRAGREIRTYNIPGGKKYQAVMKPGTSGFTLLVSHDGRVYEHKVGAEHIPTDGKFAANHIYRCTMEFNPESDIPLVISMVAVEVWADGGKGSAWEIDENSSYTIFRLEGAKGEEIIVHYTDGDTVWAAVSSSGTAAVANHTPLKKIEKIAGNRIGEVLVGRTEGGAIKMLFDGDGALRFRTDEEGNRLINTLGELMLLSSDNTAWSSTHNYLQQSDIYFMKEGWNPPGTEGGHFFASYDGAGHSLHDIRIEIPTINYTGLFGVMSGGTVKRLTLESGSVVGGNFTGAVAGENIGGTIEDCIVRVSVTGVKETGGICGRNSGTVRRCEVYGTVAGVSSEIGGICGTSSGTLAECGFAGTVEGNSSVGGICGLNTGTIRDIDLVQTAFVKGTGDSPRSGGGICGVNTGEITRCRNYTDMPGYTNTGGICGENGSGGVLSGCYNYATIGGADATGDNIGGVCGSNRGEISGCENSGQVMAGESASYTGGIAGYSEGVNSLTECFNRGGIVGGEAVGGICGCGTGAAILACGNEGSVSGYSDVGGIAGRSAAMLAGIQGVTGYIAACRNGGTVTAGTGNGGGITGSHYGGKITGCYNTGEVHSGGYAGGIAGAQRSSEAANNDLISDITACYNTGTVADLPGAGGITGQCGVPSSSTEVYIRDCYMGPSQLPATGSSSPGASVTAFVFGDPGVDPDLWPSPAKQGWGAVNPEAGSYWSSLGGWRAGEGGVNVYPKLYWEK